MKVYSIGREAGCDIVIHDSTDVVSRRHAVLSVTSSGKMTITDQSHNGTYVNGIRISPNVPVPVTRKDNISFAHVARLDWNRVPKSNSLLFAYIGAGVGAFILLIGLAIGAYFLFSGDDDAVPASYGEQPAEVPVVKADSDSIATAEAQRKAEELVKEEQRKQDSIRQHIEDSLKKAGTKPVVARPAKPARDAAKDKKPADEVKQEPKKEEAAPVQKEKTEPAKPQEQNNFRGF